MSQETASWRNTTKTWKSAQTVEDLPSKQQMIRAATRSIQILDTKIKQHISAIEDLHSRHRMEPQNQEVVGAILTLQKEMAKLYSAKQSLVKHRLALSKDVVTFGYADATLATAAGEGEWRSTTKFWKAGKLATAAGKFDESKHKRDKGKFAKKAGSSSNVDTSDKVKEHLKDYDFITKSKWPNINNLYGREEKFQEILLEIADENSDKLEHLQLKHTSARYVMTGETRIEEDEVPQYNKILESIREIIPKALQDKMDVENNEIKAKWENGDNLFRGVQEQELWDYLANDNTVGSGKTWKTAGNRGDPFVPTSLSKDYATRHAREGRGQLLLEFEGGTQDSTPTTYELRGYTEAIAENGDTFRPNEGYGGTHPVEFLHEEEIQLKKGSKRKLKSISFFSSKPSDITRYKQYLSNHDTTGIEINYVNDNGAGAAEASGVKPCWKTMLKQKIMSAAAAAGVPWKEHEHRRDPDGKFSEVGGEDASDDDMDYGLDYKWALNESTKNLNSETLHKKRDSLDARFTMKRLMDLDLSAANDMDLIEYHNTMQDAAAFNRDNVFEDILINEAQFPDSIFDNLGIPHVDNSDPVARNTAIIDAMQDIAFNNEERFPQAWADFISIDDPHVQDMVHTVEAWTAIINENYKNKYDNQERFYRATTFEELDDYIDEGNFGHEDTTYDYTAVTVSKALAKDWSPVDAGISNIIVEYDAAALKQENNAQPVPYVTGFMSDGVSSSIKSDSANEGDFAKVMSMQYANEAEVRVQDNTPVRDAQGKSKIKRIYVNNLHPTDFPGLGTDIPTIIKALRETYDELGQMEFADEGAVL